MDISKHRSFCAGYSDPIANVVGAMEQSQSVVPLAQIATPSHLGLIMPPLHHGMPTTSVAHARDTVQPGWDTVRPRLSVRVALGGSTGRARHPQSAGRFDGHCDAATRCLSGMHAAHIRHARPTGTVQRRRR
jgi:hypothetical protein